MDLKTAIEALYEEFRRPAPRHIDGSPCCWNAEDTAVTTGKPLRMVTARDLSPYLGSLFFTAGGVNDFKYFLPRIFELAATDPEILVDAEIALYKLPLADWRNWPASECKAVEQFIDAWFAGVTTSARAPDDGLYRFPQIDGLMCGLARAGIALKPYLERLLDTPLALEDLYYSNEERLECKGRLQNAFWRDCPGAEAEVVAFLRSDAVLETLTR